MNRAGKYELNNDDQMDGKCGVNIYVDRILLETSFTLGWGTISEGRFPAASFLDGPSTGSKLTWK